jgi:hypothetical protein
MTFIKRMLGFCGLTATLALASGCSDYTYFNVSVFLHQDSGDDVIDSKILGDMTSCAITVFIGDKQIERSTELTRSGGVNAICKPNLQGVETEMKIVDNIKAMRIGVFDYSSARSSGELDFVITVRKPAGDNKEVIAQGRATAKVSSGKVLEVPLIIKACSTGDHPKGQKDCQDI